LRTDRTSQSDTSARPSRPSWLARVSNLPAVAGLFGLVILICALAARLFAQQPVVEEPRAGFRAVDIYLDSKTAPLAAYQLELSITNDTVKIVGIEGGESPAFREPPFYDPQAIQQRRVILAAFSTEAPDSLPKGRTRVATVHLQTGGAEALTFEFTLQAAADPAGNKISATMDLETGTTQ